MRFWVRNGNCPPERFTGDLSGWLICDQNIRLSLVALKTRLRKDDGERVVSGFNFLAFAEVA